VDVDYVAAAYRHSQDAALLRENRRLGSADHLQGLAAECALKALLVGFGRPVGADGDLADINDRVHLGIQPDPKRKPGLWARFWLVASGRRASRALRKLPTESSEPFADWSIASRYSATAQLTRGVVDKHSRELEQIMISLKCAETDGLVRRVYPKESEG